MANFSTHLAGSTLVSAALGTTALAAQIVSLPESFLLILIGALSGLLPDLDADDSTSIGWLFSILAWVVAGAFLVFYPLGSLLEIWGAVIVIYTGVWYLIKPLFEYLTVHRGSMHSLLAVTMYTLLSCLLSLEVGSSLNFALLVAVFVFIGALTHLILDECYSVDLANNRLKASFGTAMKLFDLRFPLATVIQAGFVSGAIYYLYPFQQSISQVCYAWYQKLQQLTLLPVS